MAAAANLSDTQPGTRPNSMGLAYTAISDDTYGMFYNPAGLARSDFTEVTASHGRMISPEGLVSHFSAAYHRPLPILPGASVGAGFFNVAQGAVGAERSEFLIHFSNSASVPQLYLKTPLQYGANLKFRQAVPGREKRQNKLGLGLDMGVLYKFSAEWKAGLAILNLESGVGLPSPNVNIGAVYRWRKKINFAADIHVRKGLAELMPGVEVDLLQRLLMLRIGRGLSLDTQKQIALGLGINYSPVTIDVGMNIPWKGINYPSGGFQVSLSYKFGAPPFYGRFVGSSAREAEDLQSAILDLEEKKKRLAGEVEAAQAGSSGLKGQISAREDRLRELEGKIRQLDYEREKKVYENAHADSPAAAPVPESATEPPAAAPPPSRPVKVEARSKAAGLFPRRHRVAAGDTLRTLSEKYYGDPTKWELIYESNPDKIERGLPIEGAVLHIPALRKR